MADIRQSTTVLDDFNRADETPLSGGGNWLEGWGGPLGIDNFTVSRTEVIAFSSYWVPLEMDGDDAEAWATALGGNASSNTWRLGIMRDNGGATFTDGYFFSMPITSGGGQTRLERIDNTVATILDSNTANPPTGGGWIGLIRRNGNDVEGWASTDAGANWTLYVSATDTTYTTGFHGLLALQGDEVEWDDFGAGPTVTRRLPQIYRIIRGFGQIQT